MTEFSRHIIFTPDTALEDLKNRFLSAVYRDDSDLIEYLFTDIINLAKTEPLQETGEKYLRQILIAYKRFNPIPGKGYTQAHSFLRDRIRHTTPAYLDYATWEKRLNLKHWQMEDLFRNAITFQMTSGCSNYCRRCNEWALPKIRGHFTRDAVEKIIGRLLALGNGDLALYGGSDPLDWADPPYDISHILDDLETPCRFSILTKIPRGKQDLLRILVEKEIPLSVSLTDRNRHRIESLEAEMVQTFTKQHATSDLLIPACLDEDFTTVKPSITDSYGTEISMDGAFIIIPTFTSALHPFGHKKIPFTHDTCFSPVKKLGRPALLVDYFKPLEVVGPRGRFHLGNLLDVQVGNILLDNGDYDLTPPGMRSVKEYFEIFDDNARQKRKQMTLSVVRRHKKEYLAGKTYRDLSHDSQEEYKGKIKTHLDFTRKTDVIIARVSAASFFLTAVRAYLASMPVKAEIIAQLTRAEYQLRQENTKATPTPLADLFSDPDQDAWEIFRYQALSLVHGNPPELVDTFISQWPASYHPGKDLFIPKNIAP